jgi:hypothetical protein
VWQITKDSIIVLEDDIATKTKKVREETRATVDSNITAGKSRVSGEFNTGEAESLRVG